MESLFRCRSYPPGPEEVGAVAGRLEGPSFSLQASHGRIAVEPHHENVPERGGFPKISCVACVEDVETPVGEDDRFSPAAHAGEVGADCPPGNYLLGRVFRYERSFRSCAHGILLLASSTPAGSIVAIPIPSASPPRASRSPHGERLADPPE